MVAAPYKKTLQSLLRSGWPRFNARKSISSTILWKCFDLLYVWCFFFLLCQQWCQENITKLLYSPVDTQWCYMANGHGCYFGINAYYWWRGQQWLMCYWLEAGCGSSSWLDEHRWSSGHQQWALVTKARIYIFHSNRTQTSVTVI